MRIHRPGIAEYKIGIGTGESVLRIVNSNGGGPITSYTNGIMINSSGNVGIGTTNPGSLLSLGAAENGDYAQKLLIFESGNLKSGFGKVNSETRIFIPTNDILTFGTISSSDGTSWTENFRFTGDGRLGIGIDPPANKKLCIKGDVQINDDNWNPGDEAKLFLGPDDNVWLAHKRDVGLAFEVTSGYNIIFRDGLNENIRINGDGKLGIGTSSPEYKLSVHGPGGTDSNPLIYAQSDNSSVFNSLLRLNSPNMITGDRVLFHFGKGFSNRNTGYIGFYFNTDGSNNNRMVFGFHSNDDLLNLKANGYVGIGTTNPGSLLSLGAGENGDYAQKLLIFESGNSKSGFGKVNSETRIFIPTNDILTFGTISSSDGTSWTERLRFTHDGNIGINTTAPTAQLHIAVPENENNNPESNAIYVFNPGNNNDDDDAIITLRTGGITAGDPFLSFDILGESGWSMGIDNSDDNKFKIAQTWHDINASTRLTILNDGNLGIGTTEPKAKLDINGNSVRIQNSSTPSSEGYTGEICWDQNYIYICTSGDGPGGSPDTWKRAALTGF